jgi:hypothetical protein
MSSTITSTEKLPAHNWNGAGKLRIVNKYIKDEYNRTILFRGVNLCGNSKLPTSPNSSTHVFDSFFDHRNVCFLGRPFPQKDLEEHLSRLCNWGLTFMRLLVPWEALEHKGPGLYDEKFIDSLVETIEKASQKGIKCFIDPHQDVVSVFVYNEVKIFVFLNYFFSGVGLVVEGIGTLISIYFFVVKIAGYTQWRTWMDI